MLLSGIFPPITTPFNSSGKLYLRKLEANVEHYSRTPVAGIVALGSTGEAVMLTGEERREVLRTVREVASAKKVLIAGTGAESVFETLELTDYAASLSYDAAMVRTPHYFKKQMQPPNMLTFFRTVADRSSLPIIIYNFPQATGYDIPAELVIELAQHPNIVGIKESGGDVGKVKKMVEGTRQIKRKAIVTDTFEAVTARMLAGGGDAPGNGDDQQLVTIGAASPSSSAVKVRSNIKTREKEMGFQTLVGAAHLLHESLEAGATGAILAFADPAPTACYEIYAAWKENDHGLAREKQARIAKAAQRIVGDMGVPGVKHALDVNGYYGGLPRLPLLPLNADGKREVEALLSDIRN